MAAAPNAIVDLPFEDLVPAPLGFYTCNRTSVLHQVTQRSDFRGLLGLEYIVEIYNGTWPLRYLCRLCNQTADSNNILKHIVTTTHRTMFLEAHFPRAFYSTYTYMFGTSPTVCDGIVDAVSKRIDQKCGRLRPYSLSEPLTGQLVAQLGTVAEIEHQAEEDYNDVRFFNWHQFIWHLPVYNQQD